MALDHVGGQRLQLEATFAIKAPQSPRLVRDRFGLTEEPGSMDMEFYIRPSHIADDRLIVVSSPKPSVGQDWRADVSEFDKSNPEGVLVSASARGKVLTLVLDFAGQREILGRGPFKADVAISPVANGRPRANGEPDFLMFRMLDCRWDSPVPAFEDRQLPPPSEAARPPLWPEPPPPPPDVSVPGSTPPLPIAGADAQGFLGYPAARCEVPDHSAMLLRTAASLVVICRGPSGGLYYKGMRLSDSAAIRVDNVTADDNGFTAINPTDGTRYEATLRGLTIVVGGQVAASEAAVESAFL
ncbi:hypothetical protein K3U94_10580 [Mycolicibacter heraklionensis]|uniref:Uncharacterized protein n=1 Tax=Mycolicibacter heraklionensis TaxID=512402 RepID=A0A9X7ZI35_9MYCO|nr:hypothetical protein [Mycolicibacter heraklionensis]QZA09620.1 hypothetical protein K3U94_10580 [Mycolicibacter heraklionensis]